MIKQHNDVEHAPHGMHAVVSATDDMPAGVIYVLRNISDDVNIDNQNRLHPFYMIYIGEDGEVICDHLSPKDLLDKMRLICKGQSEPNAELCRAFNKETKDGFYHVTLSKGAKDASNLYLKQTYEFIIADEAHKYELSLFQITCNDTLPATLAIDPTIAEELSLDKQFEIGSLDRFKETFEEIVRSRKVIYIIDRLMKPPVVIDESSPQSISDSDSKAE